MEKNSNEVEIDLMELLHVLLSNLLIIVLASLTGAFLMYFYSSEFIRQKFRSSTSIYVLSRQDAQQVTYSDLQTGTQLTKDYAQLIKSRTVMNQVMADLDLQNTYPDMKNITPDQLASRVTVTNSQDTRILTITVEDTNPTRAQDISNAIRIAAAVQIKQVMDIEAVNVVDFANLPEKPVGPNKLKNAIIGFMLGFIISAAAFIIMFLTDDRIKGSEDVEKYLGLSILASIPYDEEFDADLLDKTGGAKKRKNSKKGKRR